MTNVVLRFAVRHNTVYGFHVNTVERLKKGKRAWPRPNYHGTNLYKRYNTSSTSLIVLAIHCYLYYQLWITTLPSLHYQK